MSLLAVMMAAAVLVLAIVSAFAVVRAVRRDGYGPMPFRSDYDSRGGAGDR